MSNMLNILDFNREFVEKREYEQYLTDKFPDKKMVIITCMDTRLVELLPKAMNLRNGDVKIIKNAGAIISQPFGSVVRSVLVAIYELEADEVIVIGHYGCGMTGLNSQQIIDKAKKRGVEDVVLDTLTNSGIKLHHWLRGFNDVHEGVMNSVQVLRKHPLLPSDVPVHGMVIHPDTGALEWVADGYRFLEDKDSEPGHGQHSPSATR
ncbi:carbonic anhydrase, prokaryotic type [Paenibacillus alvei TS-15]|jgi:carbonic anhydrase|uniref:carbonic anhydrase n=1 Tax=Paenibacillus alvei TS-15 TaxID=1117108 RepID=S9SJN2_PAEAL|nr:MULTISPECIES: carbonic anhydrase [Paenibacillus]EPY04293.1 carbonic anhydrase, prokaryotic type [Paenibacillus alvei TS-15]MCM3289872.1 carbonic anhydrase [Paenibacillus sp. MER 180]